MSLSEMNSTVDRIAMSLMTALVIGLPLVAAAVLIQAL